VGSTLEVRGPRNHFELVRAEHYLFVAGGIGITPLLPMIAAAAAAGAQWQLLYGGRTRASMAFLDELAVYGDRVVLQPQDTDGLLDLAGFLAGTTAATNVYCCGPEGLLRAVEERFAQAGVLGALHVERFAPKELEAGLIDSAFDVTLARSALTFHVRADQSILDVLLEAGIDVDSSCEEGTCGTCETRVLAGTPDHRDSVLTDAEKETGDSMMICVSRSRSARLLLDR
jgi:ferredoxin-NADP reductase